MRLSAQYRGGPNKFLTDFETVITDMENTLGENMADSDKVGFLTTAIAGYQPFIIDVTRLTSRIWTIVV